MYVTEIISQISIITILINLGMFVVATISIYIMINKNGLERYKNKADIDIVNCISNDVKKISEEKASVKYVDDRVDGVNHRIDETTGYINKQVDQIVSTQNTIQADIKKILSEIKS